MTDSPLQHHPAAALDLLQHAAPATSPMHAGPLLRGLRVLGAPPLRAYLHLYHRLSIVGREHLPRERSFIMVANHASHIDAPCLLAAVPFARLDRTFSVAAQEYFFASPTRLTLARIFTNAIPLGRKVHLRKSLEMCRHLLAEPGTILILFPEGTRTTTGSLAEFRPGIGSLVAGTDVPVVPCAIQGGFRAWPKGVRLPRPRALRVVIGEPRWFSDLTPGRESNERVAGHLHAAVQELLCR